MSMNNIEIEWHTDYETGVERIDFEHKIFLELLNSFNVLLKNKYNKDDAIRNIIEIEKYAEFHFISEENLMRRINYPDFKNHQIEHFDLIEKLNLAKHNNANFGDFVIFLKEWFVNHTINEDIKIKSWINEQQLDVSIFNYNIK